MTHHQPGAGRAELGVHQPGLTWLHLPLPYQLPHPCSPHATLSGVRIPASRAARPCTNPVFNPLQRGCDLSGRGPARARTRHRLSKTGRGSTDGKVVSARVSSKVVEGKCNGLTAPSGSVGPVDSLLVSPSPHTNSIRGRRAPDRVLRPCSTLIRGAVGVLIGSCRWSH